VPFLNASVPHWYCYFRKQFFYNQESHHDETVECIVFGVASVPGRALGFHVITEEGACFWRAPVSALCHKPDAPWQPHHHLQLWDCFGETVSVTKFDYLDGLRCKVMLPVGPALLAFSGAYKMTFDWSGNGFSDEPSQNKCAHLIELDHGNYALQPNNRIYWRDSSFVTNPLTENPGFKVNEQLWTCEAERDWIATDEYFYKEKKE